MYSIYVVTNSVNGKIYIGYTSGEPEWRLRLHIGVSNSRIARGRALARAIRKYGKDSFSVSTIETVATLEEAKAREIYHIKDRRSISNKVGYNMTHGGDGSPSEEVIKKRSEAMRGWNPSKETRLKMSLAKRGKPGPWLGKKRPDVSVAAKLRAGESSPIWKRISIAEIVLMYQSGMSTRRIGSMFEVDHTVIMDRLVLAGIPLRKRWAGLAR